MKLRFSLLCTALAFLSGCANVAPWERGNLAKAHMAVGAHSTHSELRLHILEAREGTSGGAGTTGGGCGCK
jgi:hypothetical protein